MIAAMLAAAAVVIAATAYLAWPKPVADEPPRAIPVSTTRSESTFSVSGGDADAIRKSLGYHGPAGHWGITRAYFEWPADFTERDGRCAASNGRVTASIRIRTPVLSWASGAPKCLREEFESMRRAIVAHEEEHARIAIEGAHSIAEALRSIAERPGSCQAHKELWNATAARALSLSQARQVEFDRRTNHGVSDGVEVRDCAPDGNHR